MSLSTVWNADAGDGPVPSSARGPFAIYAGWYNVLISLTIITFVVGSTNYSFGLFVKPAAQDLGLTRATMNVGLIVFVIGMAAFSPLLGRLMDRVSIIPVARISALVFAVTMFALSRTTTPWLMAALLAVPLAAATVGTGGLFGTVLVSRWFTHLRGRALSIMWMGTSFGGMVVVPLNALLMTYLGWRGALAAMGVIVGIMVMLLTFFVRVRPDHDTQAYLTSHEGGRPRGLSASEVLRQRDFWMIVIPVALMLSVDQTMLATITPYALDRGMNLAQAASLMSATTASAIAGKVVIAWIADRTDLRLLLALTAIFGVIQCACMVYDPSYLLLLTVCLMTGLAVGGTMPLANILLSYRFGAPSIGTVMGLQMPITLALSMFTLYFVGAVHDRLDSYSMAFIVFGGMFAASIFVLPFIRYKAPKQAVEPG
jgi:MFS family permease